MSRLAALTCLALVLLCPLLCLAETAGERCGSDEGVCEAMAVGAVVTAPADGPTSPYELAPSLGDLIPFPPFGLAAPSLWSSTTFDRGPQRVPLPASRRQALLQSFLF